MARKELITSIEEFRNTLYDGVKITTTDRIIFFMIDNYRKCCEDYGFISSNDDYADFDMAVLSSIKFIDNGNNVEDVKVYLKNHINLSSCIFLNVETSKGLLQFAVYNEHNGYYGHDVLYQEYELTTQRDGYL